MTLDPTKLAGVREAVAYLVEWHDGCEPRRRVQLSTHLEPWLDIQKPKVTPLFAALPGHWLSPDEATVGMCRAAMIAFGATGDEADTVLRVADSETLRVVQEAYRAMRDAAPSSATPSERDKSRDEQLLQAQSEAARWRALLGKVFDSRAPDYVDQAYPGWSTEARSALSTQTQGGGENG